MCQLWVAGVYDPEFGGAIARSSSNVDIRTSNFSLVLTWGLVVLNCLTILLFMVFMVPPKPTAQLRRTVVTST